MKPNKVFDETALAGKTVLVTGAARRVGAHIAATAAEAGADVILHYAHSSDEVQKTASAIRKSGHKVETVLYDFSATAEIKDFSERLFQDYHIDILVNNAAIFEPVAMADTSFTTWQKHLDINLTAPFILSQSMAAHFSPEKTGRIINILDWRAFRPGVDHFAYTVSKAALASLTKAMAASLAPRIIVNGIAFGAVLPPSDGTPAEKFLQHVPSKRLATLNEVSETVLFLMTGPEYITGEIIYLDGGRHLF